MTTTPTAQDQLFFKLCSDHLSIEAIPKRQVTVDLSVIKAQGLADHEVMMWTPYFVVLRNRGGVEVTVRKDGRMIIRKADSEDMAHEAASVIFAHVPQLQR